MREQCNIFVSIVLYVYLLEYFVFFSSMFHVHYQHIALICGHIPDANILNYKGIQIKQQRKIIP